MNSTRYLGIFAPFPRKQYLSDGWYKRIATVDYLFECFPKIYINSIHKRSNGQSDFVIHDSGSIEIFYSDSDQVLSEEAKTFLDSIKLIYIHTTHLGEDFFRLDIPVPFVIDFHGAAPEEEGYLGNQLLAERLKEIEMKLYIESELRVFISSGMKKHFESKYGRRNSVQLPIISDVRPTLSPTLLANKARNPSSGVYAGGMQKWQNIEKIIELSLNSGIELTIATNSSIRLSREEKKKFKLVNCNSIQLANLYSDTTFGFVLRDNGVVNQVAFPTKLYEYMSHGVIPIVDFANLGGLNDRGYDYLDHRDFKAGNFDRSLFMNYKENNLQISREVEIEFLEGGLMLQGLVNGLINAR
jgi:hypothetical protein